MDFTNFFFGKKTEEPKHEIGQSLRFRGGNQNLHRTFTNTGDTFTFSFWTKITTPDSDLAYLFSAGTNSPSLLKGQVTASGKLYNPTLSSTVTTDANRFRDPNAWYHIMYVSDAGTESIYVNGDLVSVPNAGTGNFDGQFAIGDLFSLDYADAHFNGYMAEWYCIDGKALQPTVFGNYDENGVWTPRDPNFEVNTQKYSSYLTSSTDAFSASQPPALAFDGNTSTEARCSAGGVGNYLEFAPATEIPFTTLEVYSPSPNVEYSFGDHSTTVASAANTFVTVATDGTLSSTQTVRSTSINPSTAPNICAIRVDGQILIDGPLYSKDLYYDAQDSGNPASDNPVNWTSTVKYDDVNVNGSNYAAKVMFDRTGNFVQTPANNDCIIWRPSQTIVSNEQVRVFIANGASGFTRFYVNEVYTGEYNLASYAGQWLVIAQDGTPGLTFPLTITSVGLKGYANTSGGFVAQVEVDGTKLLDGVGLDYGASGFHLDFSDPLDIGADRSGNANHFTAVGFDLLAYQSGYWVDNVYTATSGEVPNSEGSPYIVDVLPADASLDYTNSQTIQSVFDGSSSTYIYLVGDEYPTGNALDLKFDLRDYSNISTLDLLYADGGQTNTDHSYTVEFLDASKTLIAGTTMKLPFGVAFGSPEWVNIPVSGTPRYLRLYTTPTSDGFWKRAYLYGIRINGQILSQSLTTAPTYDLKQDSPTQNWSTLNSLISTTSGGIASGTFNTFDGNLRAGPGGPTSADATIVSTLASADRDVYVEVTITDVQNAIAFSFIDPNQRTGADRVDPYFFMANQSGETKMKNAGDDNPGSALGVAPTGETFGFHVRSDDGEIDVYNNGSVIGTSTGWSFADECSFMLSCNGAANVATVYWNYGQQPYITRPDSVRDSANLQSDNYKEQILNGREHFQVIEGAGIGYLVYDEGQDANPDPQRAAILTNPVGGTPTGGFSTSSVIFDMGAPVTHASPGFNTSGGYWATSGAGYQPITTLVSLDGSANSWTEVNEGTYIDQSSDDFIHIKTTEPFRYVRMRKNTTNNFLGLATGLMKGNVWSEPTVSALDTDAPLALGEVLKSWNNQTKINGNIPTYTVVLDEPVDTFQFLIESGWSAPFVLYFSEDGTTWRQDSQVTPGTSWTEGIVYTFTDGTPIKYARFMYNTGAGFNFGVTDPNMGSASGILELAQATFPYGLWWIKDRENLNNHEFVDSVRGGNLTLNCPNVGEEGAYSAPNGNSVAWCWNAGGAAVTNNDGSIESQVSVNTDAGFSIVSFQGTGATATVGHGLSQAPDFMLFKNRDASGTFFMTCLSELDSSWTQPTTITLKDYPNSLHINNTDSADNQPFNSTAGNSTDNFIAYCWHSVPGYSAFGSYRGNQDASGPFVYTGFAPKFILLKSSNQSSDWILLDSVRSRYNPRNAALYPNYNLAETVSATLDVDFASNGFKIRTDNATLNQGYDYVYACFAENPFSYPVTAR